jgi:DNA-binding HxlR family transcriptional regulator
VAQALEQIGDRWSFLIVRDLLRGPKRFTDLQRFLTGITPKRLTVNLRTLESEGIIERQCEPGRREVWYRLTAKGLGLVPVIEALRSWNMEYNLRLPVPGEIVHPEHMMGVVRFSLNQRGIRLPRPAIWALDFGPTSVFTLRFDGQQWTTEPSGDPEAHVRIETTPQTWAAFLLSHSSQERQRLLESMHVQGEKSRIDELLAINWIESSTYRNG